MSIKITTPNGGSDSLDFGCAQTAIVATVTGTEVSSGEGKLELKTTTGGTSATKVTVLANGRVGIGTATADEALQVNGAIKVTGGMATDTASTGAMGYQNSKYRFISWGADASTKGAYSFEGYSSNGSANATYLAILADGNVGINKAAPVTKLHIEGGGTSLPATTGTTPSAGTTLRIRPGNNAVLDIGGNSTSGAWLQSYDQTGMQTEYPLLLNPNGGNVGIGIAAPTGKFAVSDGTTTGEINPTGGICWMGTRSNHDVAFQVNASEKMRITSGGGVCINTTGAVGAGGPKLSMAFNGGTTWLCNTNDTHGITGGRHFTFHSNGTEVGKIVTTTSATQYITTSDYRLKENVEYDWDATTRLKQLKPARFNFKINPDDTVDGFIAHEAQEVVPESVTGFKDEMADAVLYVKGDELPKGKKIGDIKEKRKPVMQGIDQAKLVPLLVKTIQELEARIAKLEEDK